jgi:hypothetical protein
MFELFRQHAYFLSSSNFFNCELATANPLYEVYLSCCMWLLYGKLIFSISPKANPSFLYFTSTVLSVFDKRAFSFTSPILKIRLRSKDIKYIGANFYFSYFVYIFKVFLFPKVC